MVNNDFWLTSGWHLLDKDETGFLIPTEDFMKAYYYRPEVAPVEESCEAELALHKKLIEAPFAIIEKNELNEKIKIYKENKIDKKYAQLEQYKLEKSNNQIEIDKLKIEVKNKLDKIDKLGNLTHDPDCEHCMSNPFTLDAIETKEKLNEDKVLAGQYVSCLDSIIKKIEELGDVHDDKVDYDRSIEALKNAKKIKAPGQLKLHYSPGIPVKLNRKNAKKNQALIGFGKKFKVGRNYFNLSKKGNLKEAANNLYKTMRNIKKKKI